MARSWGKKETRAHLETDASYGLSHEEADHRFAKFGPNQLTEERRITFWAVAREEVFEEPMILLLLAVAVIYALSGELRDAVAVFLIICGITFVEVFNEFRAKAAIASLQRLAAPVALAIRDGLQKELNPHELQTEAFSAKNGVGQKARFSSWVLRQLGAITLKRITTH